MNNTISGKNAPTTSRFTHLGDGKYGMLPVAWAPHMRGLKVIVFWVLCAHADESGFCYPSRETIARLCGINGKNAANEVRKLLRELETMGAIVTEHRDQRASRYRILPPPYSGEGKSPSPSVIKGGSIALPPEGESPSLGEGQSPSQNRPRNISINKTSLERAHDGVEKTNALREPTDAQREVLETCLAWSRGVSIPLAPHLVELYRTMRPVHNLPTRPGA